MKRRARLLAACACALLAAAATLTCYDPGGRACAISCDTSGCPGDWTCLADHYCHASASESMCPIDDGDGGTSDGATPDGESDAAGPIGMYREISAGGLFSCGIDQDNALWCWGLNSRGALARDPAFLLRSGFAVRMDGNSDWHGVDLGNGHGCALRGTDLYCWGENNLHQVGGDQSIYAELVPIPGVWKAVSAGALHTCAIDSTDAAFCWGDNGQGQLGRGTVPGVELAAVEAGEAPANAWKQISAGGEVTCGIDAQDDLYCWGGLFYIGVDPAPVDPEVYKRPVEVTATTETGWRAVSVGGVSTCAIGDSGKLWCWGANDELQLGLPGTERKPEPIAVGNDTTWTAISLFNHTSCGIRAGAAVCVGSGGAGQLGNGMWQASAPTFQPVVGAPGVTTISVGTRHVCALVEDGRAVCWGGDANGELGDGKLANGIEAPVPAAPGAWSQVALGADHACGIRADKSLFCWGINDRGQLGQPAGVLGQFVYAPVQIDAGGAGWDAVDVGDGVSCGLRGGELWCWGDNTDGRAGQGAGDAPRAPMRIETVGQFETLSVGDASSCAIRVGGQRWCWGKSNQHQLGNGSLSSVRMPTQVLDSINWDYVSMGGVFGCGHVPGAGSNEILCWGARDHGQVGDAMITPTPLGTPYATGNGFTQVVASGGPGHACVLGTLGFIMCVGANVDGMLGTGDETDRSTVTAIMHSLGGGTFSDVAVGAFHTCAIYESKLYCWGDNLLDQLAEIGPLSRNAVVDSPIGAGGTWVNVMADGFGSCALDDTDQLFCWGDNTHGQFGNGAGARPAPVDVVQMP